MAEGRHERTDVRVGLLAKLGAILLVLTIVVITGVLFLFRTVVSREAALEEPSSPLAASPTEYSGPQLQVNPPAELDQVFADEQKVLTSYGWVDPEAGVVRIPIDEAMELLVERGLPARESEDP